MHMAHSRYRTLKEPRPWQRRVDYFRETEDYECALLGAMGFSTRFILSRTSLRQGQVTYRLKKAHIRRADYRNGDNEMATLMLKNMRPTVEKHLTQYLKNNLNK